MPSTTDVIQVATGVASLAVSALALREARLQRVGRDGSGPPPPAPAPHLPVATATAVPLEPSPVPPPAVQPPVSAPPDATRPPADVPPMTAPLPRPATASGPPGPAPTASPPGAPWTVGPEPPPPYARPSGEGATGTAGPESRRVPGEGAAGPDSSRVPGKGAAGPESPWPPAREPAASPASPLPSAWPPGQGAAGPAGRGQPGYPAPPSDGGAQVWPGAQERPAAARAGGWLPWVAVVGVATVFVVLGGVVLFAREDGPTVSGGRAEAASQGWVFASMALLVLTVVIALVVRGRRAPSRVVWAAVPAVLAAASVAVIVYALPVHAAVKLGAVVAALGVAAWTAFRR